MTPAQSQLLKGYGLAAAFSTRSGVPFIIVTAPEDMESVLVCSCDMEPEFVSAQKMRHCRIFNADWFDPKTQRRITDREASEINEPLLRAGRPQRAVPADTVGRSENLPFGRQIPIPKVAAPEIPRVTGWKFAAAWLAIVAGCVAFWLLAAAWLLSRL